MRKTPRVRLSWARCWGRWARPLIAALALAAFARGFAFAGEACLDCHGLKGLAVPGHALWLKGEAFAGSTHGKLTCSDCHKGCEIYPHDAARVRCDLPCHVPGTTHEALARREDRGVHARLGAPPCVGCHSGLKAEGGDPQARCRDCHGGLDRGGRLFSGTPGGLGYWAHRRLGSSKQAPTCIKCHGSHAIQPAARARAACRAEGCHPGTGERFAELFDHGRGASRSGPWGGGGPAALVLLAVVALTGVVHSLRSRS